LLEINKIYNDDCIGKNGMCLIDDESIDLICPDLPYEVTNNKWDKMIPPILMWEEFKRIIKPNGAIVLSATMAFAAKLIETSSVKFRYDIVWKKNKSTGFLNAKKMPLRSHELLLVFYKKLPTYNPQKTTGHKPVNSFTKHTSDGDNYGKTKLGIKGGGQTDRYPTSVWEIDVMNNDDEEKWQETQKPIELYDRIIKTYSNEGDLVLDCTSGSGTTAKAAIKNNRKYICFELNKEDCDRSIKDVEMFAIKNK
jgi:DNA modification methylase